MLNFCSLLWLQDHKMMVLTVTICLVVTRRKGNINNKHKAQNYRVSTRFSEPDCRILQDIVALFRAFLQDFLGQIVGQLQDLQTKITKLQEIVGPMREKYFSLQLFYTFTLFYLLFKHFKPKYISLCHKWNMAIVCVCHPH